MGKSWLHFGRFNTQPPEGSWPSNGLVTTFLSCFNTQPPEGGWRTFAGQWRAPPLVSTHSRPKAAGKPRITMTLDEQFQHTAARRRLVFILNRAIPCDIVSTHSRPKAAGDRAMMWLARQYGFNTQPPEGGWTSSPSTSTASSMFQHTAARRRLVLSRAVADATGWFQHTAARRRLVVIQARPNKLNRFQHTAARRRLFGSHGWRAAL